MLVELVAYSFLRFGGLAVPPPARPGFSGSGILSVSVTDQVALAAVPRGSQRVPMLTLELTADCGGDRTIRSVTIRHSGLGDAQDIAAVYAVSGGVRVSRSRTITARDRTLTIPLRGLRVGACQSVALQLMADFTPGAAIAGQHRLMLHGVLPVETDADRVLLSSLPPPARRAVPPAVRGRLTAETLDVPGGFRIGERRALAAFRFHAADRAQYIVQMTVTNDGTAHDNDVRDLQLEAGGKAVSAVVAAMRGDQVTFTLDPPLQVPRSGDRIVKLYGTLVAGAGRTLEFVIEENADVIVGH